MPVTVVLDPSMATVESGGSATFEARVTNGETSPENAPETVPVRVTGEAAPFSWLGVESVVVAPGSTETVRFGFRLPKSAALRAGPLPFRFEAGDAGADGRLDVAAFTALSATLDPIEVEGRGASRHTVTVATRGNASVEVTLSVDAAEGLQAAVQPPTVRVTPDRPGVAVVEVTPASAPLVGSRQDRSFTVKAAAPGAAAPVEVTGKFVSRAVFSVKAATTSVVVVGVVLLAVVARLTIFAGSSSSSSSSSSADASGASPAGATAPLSKCPAENHRDTYGVRGLEPLEIMRLPQGYTFLKVKADNCTPDRFEPCEPIHYIQNVAAAPPGVADDTRQAFQMLSQATGITFVDDGLTDENARAGPYVPDRYPGRWAPILILWDHFPDSQTNGSLQVFGNTNVMRVDDVVVSGRLRFNVDAYTNEATKAPVPPGFGPPAGSGDGPIGRDSITWGRILLHELAHVVGLGHDRDAGSLMYPDAAQQTIRPVGFSPGDLTGLRYLGKEAGCFKGPTPG